MCVIVETVPTLSINANFKERFFIAFNTNFDRTRSKIIGIPDKKMDRCCGSFMFSELPFFFPNYAFRIYPNEDRGIIFADVTLPPGSTLETENTVKELDSIIESMDKSRQDEHCRFQFAK
jgi:HAE1 family hydrophobic/amphiphilic exporter-1